MKWIDLRSDTVTWPTDEMRAAMANATVGDDVYGDDPTVLALEELAARVTGKEAALFVPSGTMGNQLAIMTHTRRGQEVICEENAHIFVHEVGAPAVLSGVSLRTVKSAKGYLTADEVAAAIRPDDIHAPETGLIEVENALSTGIVMPLEEMRSIYRLAGEKKIPVHLDGARIFGAAVALNTEVKEIAACCDSVMFCLSKGLCAPIGSMLCGSADFIARAKKNRKLLGGGMRQAGILAAAGILAIEKMSGRVWEDHANAKTLAKKLLQLPGVSLDESLVQISMVFFTIDKPGFDQEKFVLQMKENGILINGAENGQFRFVTHYWIGEEQIDFVINTMKTLLA